MYATRVYAGIRAPAPSRVSRLALCDVICEVYRRRGVEGQAVKGISKRRTTLRGEALSSSTEPIGSAKFQASDIFCFLRNIPISIVVLNIVQELIKMILNEKNGT